MSDNNSPAEAISDEELSGPVVDRRTTISLLSAAGITALAGCTGGDGSGQGDNGTGTDGESNTSKKYGGRLSAGWFIGEMNQLDPHLSNLGLEGQVYGNIFSSLVTTTPDLKVKGDLAKDWQVENAQHFTFDLRKGVKVHKGYGEITAEDFKYTHKRAMTLKGSLGKSLFRPLKPYDQGGVEVLGKHKVRLNFRKPFAPGLTSIGTAAVIPKKAAEEMSRSKFKNMPVGSGPFKITEHKLGQSIKLDKFDEYYGTDDQGNQLPYLDGVDISPIPEAATLVNSLKSGDIQYANEIPNQNVKTIKQSGGISIASPPAAGWTGVQINTRREPFTDPKVRRAIAKTIDKQEFIDQAFFGNAEPALGPIAPVHEKYYREDKPDYQKYDPEKAKQLMKEAGKLNAKVNIISTKRDLRTAKVMRKQLQDIFTVSIESLPTSTFWDRENKDYDLAVTGAAPDVTVDGPLYEFFRPKEKDERTELAGGTFNDMWWYNEKAAKLLAKQRTIADPQKRKEVLWNAEDVIMKKAPVAFTHHGIPFQATAESVKGYTPHISRRNFESVWLAN